MTFIKKLVILHTLKKKKNKLNKLPIHRFEYQNSIIYNQISHTEVFGEALSYNSLSKNVRLLGYQESSAIGFPKPGIKYVILFEFKKSKEYIGDFWCHVSEAFFKLNNIQI